MVSGVKKNTRLIRKYLVDSVRLGRANLISNAVEQFGVTRQTVHRHLAALVKEGYLNATGETRARVYTLGPIREFADTYELSTADEGRIYQRDFSYVFDGLPDNIVDICHYGFTEMVNNAIDHSEGTIVKISTIRNKKEVIIAIHDDGEGIFVRIARLLNLPDPRESLLELSKGKLTTDPDNHSGEGIFFTSRVFDDFFIFSGDLQFTHHHEHDDDYLTHIDGFEHIGTAVHMVIALDSDTDITTVFDEYSTGPDDYAFDRTVVPVRLAIYEGERLISRSQAKRLLSRVERFNRVVFDFESVDVIGQAFADELFRVFPGKHPQTRISYSNANVDVKKMIARALAVPK